MTTNTLIARLWSFCDTLRDDGVSYSDYLEQLTFLLFLKMADEYEKPPHNRESAIPEAYKWETLYTKSGSELEAHYVTLLRNLGTEDGMLGQIFLKAQNKIQDPAKLHRLVQMIGKETWVSLDADVKGDLYEGLLEKNAQDTKSGAGQYFTPRELIKTIVECVQPEPKKTIADPACGTGGFFLAAYDYLVQHNKLDKDEKRFLKEQTFQGWEIVASTARMALMNLFLHNIGDINATPPIHREDALLSKPSLLFDYVLANPPFGKKSSITVTNEEGKEEKEDLTINRNDFWVTTTNKQLNFLQHIVSMLKTTGKAAVVLPDNVLFEGGVGETVRKKLLEKTDLHTILRLPTGIFYAHGVKANVLFFDAKPASKDPWTKEVWIYDYRTNISHTLKKSPLRYEHLKDFVKCYNPGNRHKRTSAPLSAQESAPLRHAQGELLSPREDGSSPLTERSRRQRSSSDASDTERSRSGRSDRWRKYTYDEIMARDKTSLDIFWLRDDSMIDLDNLPEPDVLAAEIVENIEAALESFRTIAGNLED